MRLISTLLILLFTISTNAQNDNLPVKLKGVVGCGMYRSFVPEATSIKIDSPAIRKKVEEPLLIIDGFPYEYAQLKKLNPDDIVSIQVLKEVSSRIIGCRPSVGVLIITTKDVLKRKFIIKDKADNSIIPGATISFAEKNNTIKGATDDKGVFTADKLQRGVQYEMNISSVGYKTIKRLYTLNSLVEQDIFLERDVKESGSVVVVGYTVCAKYCRMCCGVARIYDENISKAKVNEFIAKSIYPNPVQRNNVFNLEFKNEKDETLQLSVAGFDGRTVMMQPQKVIAGSNRISIIADPRWTAGVYIVLVKNEKGNVIKQDKLIVQ